MNTQSSHTPPLHLYVYEEAAQVYSLTTLRIVFSMLSALKWCIGTLLPRVRNQLCNKPPYLISSDGLFQEKKREWNAAFKFSTFSRKKNEDFLVMFALCDFILQWTDTSALSC